jgi:hypothetical protein
VTSGLNLNFLIIVIFHLLVFPIFIQQEMVTTRNKV